MKSTSPQMRFLGPIVLILLVSLQIQCNFPGASDSEGEAIATDQEGDTSGDGPDPLAASPVGEPAQGEKFIYVVSGPIYAGSGVTADSPANTVTRFSLDGTFDRVVVDYNSSPGDGPVAVVDYNKDDLLVLVENASGRRIDRVERVGGSFSTFLTNSAALNGQVRSLTPARDGGWVVSKTSAIEKFNSGKARVRQGVNSFIQNPAGDCAMGTPTLTRTLEGPAGTVIVANAASAPYNKLLLFKENGYASASDCVDALAAPTSVHFPTAMLLHTSGILLVAYSNGSVPMSEIHAHSITQSEIGPGVLVFSNPGIALGVSAMAELPNGNVIIASAASGYNSIEEFTFDAAAITLSRAGNFPLLPSTIHTRSISGLLVSE